jgi:serine/threonine-protein kinase
LLAGATVESLSERQRLPLAAVSAIGVQVLDVLARAHERGVVHRDIKPANLFVTDGGSVKILDFGIARLREPGGATATQTGLMLGTPAFMAPEQALGRTSQIDGRTDLWAVGATLFTLVSGRIVHDAATAQEALVKAATLPAPSLRAAAPDAPEWLAAIVDRALAFDSASRFASAKEMLDSVRSGAPVGFLEAGVTELAALVATSATVPLAAFVSPAAYAPPGKTEVAVVTAAPTPRTSRQRLGVPSGVAALAATTTGLVVLLRSGTELDSATPGHSAANASIAAPPAKSAVTLPPTATSEPQKAPSATPEAPPPPSRARTPQLPARRPASSAAAPSATRERAPPVPAPPARSNCNPPYRLDASGMKVWKRECF